MRSGLDVDFPAAMIKSRSTLNEGACDGELFMFLQLHVKCSLKHTYMIRDL